MNCQSREIGCVWKTPFCKSGHIYSNESVVCEEKGNIKLFTETDSSTCVDETL